MKDIVSKKLCTSCIAGMNIKYTLIIRKVKEE